MTRHLPPNAQRWLRCWSPLIELGLMLGYYVTLFVVGCFGFFVEHNPPPSVTATEWSFAVILLLLAPLGALYRLKGWARAEAVVLLGLASASLLQGVALLSLGHTQSGLRIAAGFLMMTAVALAIHRSATSVVLSKKDLDALREAATR